MKFYAVKKGTQTGIFKSWEECLNVTKGFSSPDYKSFNTEEEAQSYLDDRDLFSEIIKKDLDAGYLVAFTDGSYDEKLKKYSHGVLIIDENLKEHELCGSGSVTSLISSRNIAGEIFGVMNALDWAISNNYSKVKIYHDYEGLSKWYNGEWKSESDIAKFYVDTCVRKYKGVIQVDFFKVKGHSNNKYNDKVDALARSALFDGKIQTVKGDNWTSITNVALLDLEKVIEMIVNDNSNIALNSNEDAINKKWRLVINKESLTITYFKTSTKKILIQGKMSVLFQMFLAYITEFIGEANVIQIFKDAYRKTIKIKEINEEFNSIYETLPSNYPQNVKIFLKQAIINLKYYVESEDYSQYIFPVLKALEGHLKYLFSCKGIIISKAGFTMFNFNNGKHFLNSGIINDIKTVGYIENCYNFWNVQRHTLFHFGDIIGSTDNSRLISTKKEADEIIKDSLQIIVDNI